MKYFENYWIKKRGIKSINYYDIIINMENKNKLKYIFISNNIIESFHGKIERYLPKGATTIKVFLISMNKILKDIKLEKHEVIRHDIKAQTLILIANKFNESKEVKWISYNEYKNIEYDVIRKSYNNMKDEEISNLINNLNNINDDIINDNILEVLNEELENSENKTDEFIEENNSIEEEIEIYEEVNYNNNLIEASNGQREIYKNKLKTLNDIFENSIIISDFNDDNHTRENKNDANLKKNKNLFVGNLFLNIKKRTYNDLKRLTEKDIDDNKLKLTKKFNYPKK